LTNYSQMSKENTRLLVNFLLFIPNLFRIL